MNVPPSAEQFEAAFVIFKSKMDELRKKRLDWLSRVVARMEKENIEAVRASINS